MAEAVAAIGLAAAILQFIDFGSKAINRLREFQSHLEEVPKAFQSISNILPLLIDGLGKVKEQVDAGHLPDSTKEAFLPTIRGSLSQVEQLNSLLKKVLPTIDDSPWRRGKKAVVSLGHEPELARIETALRENFQIMVNLLTLYNVGTSHRMVATAPKSVFMLPFERDSKFVGRQKTIEELHGRFRQQRRVALAGLGGVGKSQVAIEYCYQFNSDHPSAHIFWVYAGTAARFEQAYKEISKKLLIPGWEDAKVDHLRLVSDWLSEEGNGQWLMVVDNADDNTIFFHAKTQETPPGAPSSRPLAEYIPNSPIGSVLITTRDARVGERLANRNKPIAVLPMTATEAESLLRSKVPDDELYGRTGSLEIFFNELAFLPLAITQAAAFISENSISILEYLDLLRAGDDDVKELLNEHLEDPRRESDTENSVMRTWKLSFDQILEQKPGAAEILSLMAVLDLQGVPRWLLRHHQHEKSEIEFTTAVGTLKAFSLVSVGKGKDTAFRMHRLVQLSTQKWLESQSSFACWQTEALRVLSNEFPEPTFEVWATCEALIPHVQVALSNIFTAKTDLLRCAKLFDLTAKYEVDKGKYTDAYEKGMRGFEMHESLLPSQHPFVLQSAHTVGCVLILQRKLPAAKEMLQRATTGRIAVLGHGNLDTLQSMHWLAHAMMRMLDFDGAEELCDKALKETEKLVGLDHPRTLQIVHLNGNLMWYKMELDRAEVMLKRSLKGREQILGPDHPDMMESIHSLAHVSGDQGNFDTAIEMYRRVAEQGERMLGLWHPQRMVMVLDLADCLRRKGDLRAAEDLYRDSMSGCGKALGTEDPTTMSSIHRLADILIDKGETVEATTLFERLFPGWHKVLGAEHPHTLLSLHQLAHCKNAQGDYQEAENLFKQALAGFQKVFGADHLHSFVTLRSLAWTIHEQGPERFEDAEQRYRQAAIIGEKLQGKEHPDVLSDLHVVAFLLYKRGEYREAEVLNRRVLRLREKILGQLDMKYLQSVNDLAWAIQRQGTARLEEAEELHRRAFAGYKQVLGPEGEEALLSLTYLRDILDVQHKYDESENMHRLLISIKEKKLGPEHREVLVACHDLAWNLSQQGRYQESEKIYRRVVFERDRALGKFHSDTLSSIYNMAKVIRSQGSERHEEAEKLYRSAFEGYEETLGTGSDEALGCLENLISLLEAQDRPQEVSELRERLEEIYRRVFSERDKTLGQFHPDTLSSVYNLARVIRSQGSERYEEVENLYRRELEGYEQTLGPRSEKALGCLEDLISLLEEVQDRLQEVWELREHLEKLQSETEDSNKSSDEPLEESLGSIPLVTSVNADPATTLPSLDDSCTSSTLKGAKDPTTAVPRSGSDHDLFVLVPSKVDDALPSSLSEPVRIPERLKQVETESGIQHEE